MRKYITYFYLSVLDQLEYRTNLVTKIVFRVIPVIGFFYLWRAVYLGGARYGSYDLAQLATFFLVSTVIDLITPTYMTIDNLSENVRTGFLSSTLLKPVVYMPFQLANFLGERLVRLIAAMGMTVVAVFLFRSSLTFPASLGLWLIFLVSAVLAVALAYCVFFIISIVSFWTTRVTGVAFAAVMVTGFLSGTVVPLDLLPNYLQWLTDILPFKYILFFPTKIFINMLQTSDIVKGLVIQVIWILLTLVLSKSLWQVGLKKYESVGS